MKKKLQVILISVIAAIVVIVGVICFINIQNNSHQANKGNTLESKLKDLETIETESVFPETESEIPETESETETETEAGNGHIVALDPGHQSFEVDMSAPEPIGPGASQTKMKATTGTAGKFTGVPEYQLVLTIGLALRDELEQRGYEVVMTREDNMTAISNKERAELAANAGADILVRIHADGNNDTSVHGAMTMVPSASNPYVAYLHDDSYKLGEQIINAYCSQTGMKNNGVVLSDNMSGINWSTVPVTILEMGFMSNQTDDENMQDAAYQKNMVQGIADGIDAYFELKDSENASESENQNTSENTADSNSANDSNASQNQQTTDADMIALKAKIKSLITDNASAQDKWAVCVLPLDGRDSVVVNNAQMQAASLIKLYIMAAVYDRYSSLTQTYGQSNVDALIYSMITVSDNNAANTLTNYLGGGSNTDGRAAVTTFCQNNGYTQSSMGRMLLEQNPSGENYTSVADCANFLKDIYNGKYAYSSSMIDVLKQQQRTSKIPAGIPAGITTANKTGELSNVENDAAIIYASGSAYIMCVMTENLYSPANTRNLIVAMSGEVYQYFE